jgi:5'-3' exonuclease
LRRQFAHCKALCSALGLTVLAHQDYEADDLIGTALHVARANGHRSVIVSADKDLSQLLAGLDEQWDYARGQRWSHAGVKARHGVEAHQIADYLALTGDAVDNIPGVPGVGSKTAAVLLAHFGSLDALLARVDEVQFLRLRGAATVAAKLRANREQALLWRQLTTIALDAPLHRHDFARGNADAPALLSLCENLRFGPLTRRRLQEASGVQTTATVAG